ncbi:MULTISPECIES: PIN domain-containing protein [unclassified Mesorhizobium]|uniref:PIN domain-containing protein n=1 Tax=unclassified Mesorhizobium TaxID=325217 RepID=UPI00333D83C6
MSNRRKASMTLRLLVDTCVWLDLAKDYRQQPVISALEELVEADQIELLVPEIVLNEFERNKGRVATDAQRSLQSHFSLVRDAVSRFGDEASKAATLKALNEVDHTAVFKGEAVNESISRIETLLKSVPALPTTDAVKQRVTDRALAKLAPFHRSRNSAGDAVIIETYAQQVVDNASEDIRLAFVTHNSKDFSEDPGDQRKPHIDLLMMFGTSGSTYSVSLIDMIKEVDADLLANHDFEFNGFSQPRRLSEILEAENLLFRQVWYNRHWNLRTEIESGEHHVVAERDYSRKPYRQDQTLDTIWAGALAAAKRTEEEIGIENLGPWTDFEWGMLNGKLSALRWVMGDDWDMLDT